MARPLFLAAFAPLLGALTLPASAKDECSPSYGKPDQVIADCTGFLGREGLEIAKRSAALRNRAGAYREKKDMDRALADLNERIRIDPSNPDAFYDRASLYRFDRVDIDRSLSDINEAIRLQPNSYPNVSFRGALDLEKNDLEAATADFGEEIRLNPRGAIAYDVRGGVWLMRGDYKRALEDFEVGFKLAPDYSNVIKNRNRTHATLAAGAAIDKADSTTSGTAPNLQANRTKNLYSEARSWKVGDNFHHCTFEFYDDKSALTIGRSRSGYVLALASSQWSLSPGTSYSVQVLVADAPKRSATAIVVDDLSIAIPLGDDKDFIEQIKGYNIPIDIEAGQNVIKAPRVTVLSAAENLESCFTKAVLPAASNPFASPASNPFGGAPSSSAAPR